MNKLLLSLLIFTSSLFLTEARASSQPLSCKFHNSRKCIDPEVFKKELEIGCARPAGNCRAYFCKANCLDISDAERKTLALCKKNCFDPSLLVRFDASTREALYSNFFPSEGRSGKRARKYGRMAYGKESAVQAAKAKQWWRFGRAPKNTQLYEKLRTEHLRLISEKVKKMEAATARQDSRMAAKLKAEVARDIEEATETLAQPHQLPPVVGEAQAKAENDQLSPKQRELARKVLRKWWSSTQGKKEAQRVQKERDQVAQTLIQKSKAPADILPETQRRSGTWADGPQGRYFIPKAPPLPQSEKVKRLSMELRRQSASIDDFPPPPPPSSDESLGEDQPMPPPPSEMMGGSNVPPPPPMMPAGWTKGNKRASVAGNFMPPPAPPVMGDIPPPPPMPTQAGGGLPTDLQAQIRGGAKLRKVASSDEGTSVNRPSSTSDGRGALLAQIQGGAKLKKVAPDQKRAGSSAPLPGSKEAALFAALKNRRFAIDDERDSGNESADDEWEE